MVKSKSNPLLSGESRGETYMWEARKRLQALDAITGPVDRLAPGTITPDVRAYLAAQVAQEWKYGVHHPADPVGELGLEVEVLTRRLDELQERFSELQDEPPHSALREALAGALEVVIAALALSGIVTMTAVALVLILGI